MHRINAAYYYTCRAFRGLGVRVWVLDTRMDCVKTAEAIVIRGSVDRLLCVQGTKY